MLSLIFHFRFKIGWCLGFKFFTLNVLPWTWNLEQRLLLGVTYHQAIVWFAGRRRLPKSLVINHLVLCVNCARLVFPTLWLQLLLFMLFPSEHFKKERKLVWALFITLSREKPVWAHFITLSFSSIPCQLTQFFVQSIFFFFFFLKID